MPPETTIDGVPAAAYSTSLSEPVAVDVLVYKVPEAPTSIEPVKNKSLVPPLVLVILTVPAPTFSLVVAGMLNEVVERVIGVDEPVYSKSKVPFVRVSHPPDTAVVFSVPDKLHVTVGVCELPLLIVTRFSVVLPDPPKVTLLEPVKVKFTTAVFQ